MEHLHWIFVGTALLVMPVQWFLLVPFNRGWKPWTDHMADQAARSAALATECSALIELET
jgi:ABC-type sulfate transport system permease subunit